MSKYPLLFAFSALFALLLTPPARLLAKRVGAIDRPDARRIHSAPMPRLGGPAIYGTLLLSLLVMARLDAFVAGVLTRNWHSIVLAAGGAAILAVGAIDDCRPLPPAVKLLLEALISVSVVAAGIRINAAFGWELGWTAVPLSVLWIVAVTNGVNMIDGLDGLAAGAGLISSATLFSVALYLENIGAALVLAALCGALFGFLCYNFHPARIFLGDSGSLLAGFLLAVTAIESSSKAAATVAILVPVLAMGLPLGELILTTLRRALRAVRVVRLEARTERYEFSIFGRPALFTADRRHIHHRLLTLGITHRAAVVILYGLCAAMGLTAFMLASYRQANLAILLAAFAALAAAAIRRLGYGELQLLRNGLFLPLFDLLAMSRRLVHVLFDFGFIITAWLGACLIHYNGELSGPAKGAFLRAAPLIALLQIGCLMGAGLYRRAYRYVGIADLLATLKGLAFAGGAGWFAIHATGHGRPALGLAVLDAYLLATLTITFRLSFRVLEHLFNAGQPGARRTVIYGAGNRGVAALHELQFNLARGMEAVAFLDDDPRKWGRMVHGLPIYQPQALEALLRAHKIDELVIATAKIPEELLEAVRERCALAGVPLRRFQITLDDMEVYAGASIAPVIRRRTTAASG